MSTFRNPVLPGFHPDPSVCRVGDDYYLVVSSFTFFPGIPVLHSRDLVNWEPIGHVIDRGDQLSLAGMESSDGVWAPTIRYHEGLYYVVFTVASGRQGAATYLATAMDPAGRWSDLIALEADGIDPSLFFDDDGRCWFTACRDSADPSADGPGELWMRELDLETKELTGPTHILWHGALRGAWVEAPHVFKHDGIYHLIAAEGGTERNHSVTAAQARVVTGPYRTDPRSPLLTHRHLSPNHEIQNVGHADLVTTPAGETWAVLLAVRPIDGTHVLGRETFLVPVEWTSSGPVFSPASGLVQPLERVPIGMTAGQDEAAAWGPRHETFDGRSLPSGWVSIRGDVRRNIVVGSGEGLILTPSREPLWGRGTPAFVGRAQRHTEFTAKTSLSFSPSSAGEKAGIVVFAHQDRFATLAVTHDENGTRVAALERQGDTRVAHRAADTIEHADTGVEIARTPVSTGDIELCVRGSSASYVFQVRSVEGSGSDGQWIEVGQVDRAFFSTESAGGFLGVHIGLFGTNSGQSEPSIARFESFSYAPVGELAQLASVG